MTCVLEDRMSGGLEDELSCPVCLELYQDPVVLPCRHNFCRECLRAHIQQLTGKAEQFPCPLCQCAINLKDNQIAELPRNFSLANIISKFQLLKLECTETEAGSRLENQGFVCETHRRSLTVFCNTCSSVICTKCLTDHPGHHTQDLEDKVLSCKDEVKQSVLPKITKLTYCLVSTQQDLTSRSSSMEEHIRNDWKEVMDTFGMLRSVLDQKESELRSNLQTRKEAIHSYFETEMQKVDSQLKSLKQLKNQGLKILQQHSVPDTNWYQAFKQYTELLEATAELEVYEPLATVHMNKGSLNAVHSKQGICDTLRRIAEDLDKIDLSSSQHSGKTMVVECVGQDIDVHMKSKVALERIRKHTSNSGRLTSNGSDSPTSKTRDRNMKKEADLRCQQVEDAEKPGNESTLRYTDKRTQQSFIKKMLSKSLEKQSEVFIVSNSWIGKCQTFLNKKEGDGIHPGPVDNSPIMETDDSLSSDLLEGYDFVAINESGWTRIVDWFGLKDGQKPIRRKVISEGLLTGALSVELYPMRVVLVYAGQKFNQCYSKTDSLGFLKQEFHRIFNLCDKDLQMKIKVGGIKINYWIDLSREANSCSLKDAGITHGTEIHCDIE
ncbi:uncharacterized protein LOC132565167 [Ylistrum balloti]|uniref:uncharacterized protein LOC132565167 n=1 Tax=Ylistrum balloti TaxID=509963 RepID=UPI002905E578|nr:uncharacterized protein LOC132565167 [Ylistrum balloti]XP_060085772.1 uncharacterized protein LOC132565167 [Ylistrum balloti]